ncbi:MAG: hypothetical protein IJ758_01990 [Clostridia bacterium]|nr:hypothetical protein [Clostridia bacterium]
MWVSKEIVSAESGKNRTFFGKVTDADGANLTVQTEIENRNPKIICPHGVVSIPEVGAKVVVTNVEDEFVISGAVQENTSLEPGELMLYSAGGASIILKNDGKVLINGNEYIP